MEEIRRFQISQDMQPAGDQPQAIAKLCEGLKNGDKAQTLLGVTGSGKTFTMAQVIQQTQRPALILAHNKTLAGQLWQEFRALFPDNAVEFFVSYYDYYQPEAYIHSTDTYIEKDSSINDEIDRMRHAATNSLLERRDVIVVASVSCIYGIGNPEDYRDLMVHLRPGQRKDRDEVIRELVSIQYERNDFDLRRGTFRVRGDTLDVFPADSEHVFTRVSFFGDEIEKLTEYDATSRKAIQGRTYAQIYPASHYASTMAKTERAVKTIEAELEQRLELLRQEGKLIEAYRLEQRTRYDMDLLLETGFCKGIENYSRHLDGRQPGQPPYTLLDFFPDDYLLFIDESHVTIPQIGAMFNGDHSRKESLVDYGFRLPSAFDNRPLRFGEFEQRMGQTIFVSATPSQYEKEHAVQTAEQIIRPTGLLDPKVYVRPVQDQIEDILREVRENITRGERSLILTLTKKMAEDLSDYLIGEGLKVRYLHSDIKTVERLEILRGLRQGKFDVLVGINLLREGLDLPEVSLIAILDADKEGFLRSETSLIQIIGRAARNLNGRVVLYADEVTDAMYKAMTETERRRAIQQKFNEDHGIVPRSIQKNVRDIMDTAYALDEEAGLKIAETESLEFDARSLSPAAAKKLIRKTEQAMKDAAARLDFEEAAALRDQWIMLRGMVREEGSRGEA